MDETRDPLLERVDRLMEIYKTKSDLLTKAMAIGTCDEFHFRRYMEELNELEELIKAALTYGEGDNNEQA